MPARGFVAFLRRLLRLLLTTSRHAVSRGSSHLLLFLDVYLPGLTNRVRSGALAFVVSDLLAVMALNVKGASVNAREDVLAHQFGALVRQVFTLIAHPAIFFDVASPRCTTAVRPATSVRPLTTTPTASARRRITSAVCSGSCGTRVAVGSVRRFTCTYSWHQILLEINNAHGAVHCERDIQVTPLHITEVLDGASNHRNEVAAGLLSDVRLVQLRTIEVEE
mmetsp:Transcript_34528/g.79972  ORF Transcript_34528/g.79972 Transcript_34528/m.79972 type:complete len:222 (+) Transcript_34528:223-888(+)